MKISPRCGNEMKCRFSARLTACKVQRERRKKGRGCGDTATQNSLVHCHRNFFLDGKETGSLMTAKFLSVVSMDEAYILNIDHCICSQRTNHKLIRLSHPAMPYAHVDFHQQFIVIRLNAAQFGDYFGRFPICDDPKLKPPSGLQASIARHNRNGLSRRPRPVRQGVLERGAAG